MKTQPTTVISFNYSGRDYKLLGSLLSQLRPSTLNKALKQDLFEPEGTGLKFEIRDFPEEVYEQMNIKTLFAHWATVHTIRFNLVPADLGTAEETWKLMVGFGPHDYLFDINLQNKTVADLNGNPVNAERIINLITKIRKKLELKDS
jgi:hypothetical protein